MIADDGGLYKGNRGGGAQKWSKILDILKLEPTVFVDGLDIGYKEKKES